MKKTKKDFAVVLVAATLILLSNFCFVIGTEDEYEDDHADNVVEHPVPTLPPSVIEIEEKVEVPLPLDDGNVPFIGANSNYATSNEEEEDIIQTTTYPVFDEPLTSTTAQAAILFPPTSTSTSTSTTEAVVSSTTSSETSSLPTTPTSTTTVAATALEITSPSSSFSSFTTTEQSFPSSTTTTASNSNAAVPFLPPHQRPARSDLASMPLPQGQELRVGGNLTVYESPVTNQTFDGAMLIAVHDIFGFHPHVKYISDRLAEFGFRTIVPDFFHGRPVAIENFPPPNFTDTARFLFSKDGFWKPVRRDLLNVMSYYREVYNVTSFGMYGFCWGGKMIIYASADKDFSGINAIGLVHPSRVVTQDANEINAPAILLPSNAEADMIPFLQILERRFGEGKSEHHRYDDMRHGFAGATSDFSNTNVRTRVEDAIEKLGGYFRKHLV